MNPVVLNLIPKDAGTPAVKSAAPAVGGEFSITLADRLRSAAAAPTTSPNVAAVVKPAPAGMPGDAQTLETLQADVTRMMKAGASHADIVAALATRLAASVAPSVDPSGSQDPAGFDAGGKLQTVFAVALAPPAAGDGAGGSIADRARNLAQRYMRLETAANSITGQAGQQKRIAGNILDAQRAKDIPAQTIANDPALTASTDASDPATAAAVLAGLTVPAESKLGSKPVPLPSKIVPVSDATLLAAAAGLAALPVLMTSASSDQPDAPDAQKGKLGSKPAPLGTKIAPVSDATLLAAADLARLAVPTASLPNAKGEASGSKAAIHTPAARLGGAAGSSAAAAASAVAVPAANQSSPPPAIGLVPDAAAESAALLAASGNRTSDGPTVKLGAKTAIATGGDTLLGRILTRSVLAADARQAAPAPPAAVAPDDASSASQAGTGGHPNAAAADSAVSAFVKQFEAALKAGTSADAAQTISNPLQSGAPGVPPAPHAALEATPSIGPAVAPFAIVRAEAPAAPTPAAVAPPIDHSAIADQVLRGAFMRNVGQSSEMRLTLTPNSLGDVTVKLVVNAGSVTAHVVAETADVRDALVAAQPQLTKSLADAGLKLTGFSVDLSGGGFAGFSQQNDQSRNGDRSRRPADVADGDESIPDSRLEAIPSFAPSAVSRSRVGDYNYLA